jgi:diaminopropionate ammonia-lyase
VSRLLHDYWTNPDAGALALGSGDGRAMRFHRSIPGYRPTTLVEAPRSAAALGLTTLAVKMETERFGLPSFKILGAAWATCRQLSALSGRAQPAETFGELRDVAASLAPLTLVAATDGNHGRAVARVARWFGLGAVVLVPRGTADARIAAIAAEGAQVQVVPGTYDDAVTASAELADDRHIVVSDTSWPGYEEVPRWVIDGYGTIFAELAEQAGVNADLVPIQIGVGALAAATVRSLSDPHRIVVGVEPADAACALAALRDGEGATTPGPHGSVMVGLNCGIASQVALPDLRAGLAGVCAIGDAAVASAVRMLLDDGLTCGETGAAGVAGLVALRERWGAQAWARLGTSSHPRVLTICTEAPTDPESFARIAAGGS